MFKGWSFCLFHSNLYISMFFFFFCLSVIHRSDGRMMTKATLVFFLTLVKMFLVNFTKHDLGFWTKMEIFCHDKEVSIYSHCFVLFFNIRNGCRICQMTCQHPPWWAYGFHVWLSLYDTVYSYTSWDWTILTFWNNHACLIVVCCLFKVMLGFSLLIFQLKFLH